MKTRIENKNPIIGFVVGHFREWLKNFKIWTNLNILYFSLFSHFGCGQLLPFFLNYGFHMKVFIMLEYCC